MKTKPFDLESALAGEPVVTKDGQPVEIIQYRSGQIIGWINKDKACYWFENGNPINDWFDCYKLLMLDEPQKAWLVVANFTGNDNWYSGVFTDKVEAIKECAKHQKNNAVASVTQIELPQKEDGIPGPKPKGKHLTLDDISPIKEMDIRPVDERITCATDDEYNAIKATFNRPENRFEAIDIDQRILKEPKTKYVIYRGPLLGMHPLLYDSYDIAQREVKELIGDKATIHTIEIYQ